MHIKKLWPLPSLKHCIIFFFLLFFISFPKGGIKCAGIPITWGYLVFFFSFFIALMKREFFLSRKHLVVFLGFSPFIFFSCATLLVNGINDMGYAASYFIHFFCVLPFFLLCLPQQMRKEDFEQIFEGIKKTVFFVSVYGIFLFFYKIITGDFFQIPFLTVNYHDYNFLEETKCIDRGGVFKLISTYNNGNLYGICILMLLPLYTALEKRHVRVAIVKSSLLLTLSRSVWIGALAYELCYIIFFEKSLKRKGFYLMMISMFGLAGSTALQIIFPIEASFIFDRFLGSRIGQLDALNQASWLSCEAFNGIWEVIYLGILHSFGVCGLITFLWAFFLPLIVLFFQKGELTTIQKRAACGLYLYLFVACADGALLLIPVLTFCFFILFLLSSEQIISP